MTKILMVLTVLGTGPVSGPLQDPVPAEDGAGLEEVLQDEGLDALLEGEAPAVEQEGARDVLSSWKGFVQVKPRIYLRDRGGDRNDGQFLFESEFEFDFRFSPSVSAYFRPRILADAFDSDLKRFEPYEAYATYEGEGWDLRAGQMVENWGIVDTYNPIDVVSRRDFAGDILDPDRLGELGVRGRLLFEGGETIGEPTVSVYAMPVFRRTLFPPEDQRFGFGTDLVPFEEDEGFEPQGAEEGLYAIRLQSTLETAPANADLQLLASRGPERMPAIILSPAGTLVPAYYGVTAVGGGFRAVPNQDTLGSFLASLTLKTEVTYKAPYTFDDSPIDRPDEYVAYVVGVDRQFFNVLRDQDALTVTVEYAGEEGADDPTAILRPFQNDLILRLFWEANDFSRTSLEVRGIRDIETGETIGEVIAERQLRFLHENLKATLQLQAFDPPGTGESFFDFFPNNSSLALAVRWDF